MSNHDARDGEERLTRALHQRADDGPSGNPIGIDDVRRSARQLRRRRSTLVAAAAAAAVVVAVPIALGATRVDRAEGPVAPAGSPSPTVDSAPPSPSATVTPTKSPSPSAPTTSPSTASGGDTTVLSAADAGRGYLPRTGYLQGTTLHEGDGTTARLPGRYLDVTSYHGGWLATGRADQGTVVVTVAADGTVTDTRPGAPELALSADGTEVSWLTGDGPSTLHHAVASGMSDSVDDQQVAGSAEPVGFVGAGRVAYQTRSSNPQVRVSDFAGHDVRVAGLLAAGGAYQPDGLLSGMVSVTGSGSCWVVRSVDTGHDLWRTCDFSLGRFSPDGRHVIGYSAYRDGLGDQEVAVLDARTGRVVQHWRAPADLMAFAHQVVWEDEGDLLASWYEKQQWSVLRLSVGGSLSTALGPQAGTSDQPPWEFTTRP